MIRTALACLLLLASPAAAEEWPSRLAGRVVAVDDGDTLTLLEPPSSEYPGGKCWEVRMSDYDSPERAHSPGEPSACTGRPSDWPPSPLPGQPRAEEAGDALKRLALGREATARCYGSGSYGRIACTVYIDGRSVNAAMIQAGWGWVFRNPKWVREKASRQYEAEARAAGRGIWQDPAPIDPSKWRHACWRQGRCQ